MTEDTNCSWDFFEAFSSGCGSYVAECTCGRQYFASHVSGVFQTGELEELQAKAELQPDKYIDTGNEEVLFTDLGSRYVHGCACNAEKRHEDWIWAHRYQIMKYLKTRAAKELKSAKEQAEFFEGG